MSSYTPDWDKLLTDVEEAIQAKLANHSLQTRQRLIDCVDRLFDELRSGEHPGTHVKRLMNIFQKLLDAFERTEWIIISTSVFTLMHLYPVIAKEEEYLVGKDVHVLRTLEKLTSVPKREVRDAASQSFGGLAEALGNKIFSYLGDYWKQERNTYEALEGFMMSVGYITSKCSDISVENWLKMVDLLVQNMDNTQFQSYSSYIRLQAVKALNRVLKNLDTMKRLLNEDKEKITKVLDLVESKVLERLCDENIDVRKWTAQLFNSLFLAKLNTLTEKKQRQDLVKEMVTRLIKSLESATKWENRHGLCDAFHILTQNELLLSEMDMPLVRNMIDALKKQVAIEDKNPSAYAANSAAGRALTHTVITLSKIFKQSETLEEAMEKLKLTEKPDLNLIFKEHVEPQIVAMLKSTQPVLLDAGGACLLAMMVHAIDIVKPYVNELLSLLYKNKFHASYPIRNSAQITWNQAIERMNFSDQEYLTNLTPQLVSYLLTEVEIENYEVREIVFKALDDLFSHTKSEFPSQKENALKLYAAIKKGTLNTAGGTQSEYPQSAAISAFGSFMSLISTSALVKDSNLLDQMLNDLMRLTIQYFGSKSDLIVAAALQLVKSLVQSYTQAMQTRIPYLCPAVLALTKVEEDSIKNVAISVFAAMVGNLQKAINNNPKLFGIIMMGLNSKFGFEEGDEMKETASIALRDLAALDLSACEFAEDTLKSTLVFLAKGLLVEANRDSTIIQANCLLLLRTLTSNKAFLQGIKSGKPKQLMLTILKFLLYLVSNTVDDFDFDEEIFTSKEDDEPDIEFEEFSISKLPEYGYFQIGRLKTIVDIVVNTLPATDDEYKKSYVGTLCTLLRSYAKNADFKENCTSLLATILFNKQELRDNSVIQLLKEGGDEFDLAGKLRTTKQLSNQCAQLFLNSSEYAQKPHAAKVLVIKNLITGVMSKFEDDATIEKIYQNASSAESDSTYLKALYLQLAVLTAPKKVDHLVTLAKFHQLFESSTEDEPMLYSLENPTLPYQYGNDMGTTTPCYLANQVVKYLNQFWTSLNDTEKSSIVNDLIPLIKEAEETEQAKLFSILYFSIANRHLNTELNTKLVDDLLLDTLLNITESDEYCWAWRAFEAIATIQSTKHLDKLVTFVKDNRSKMDGKSQVAACIALAESIKDYNGDVAVVLQLLSDVLHDDEIDEGKQYLPRVLHNIQERSKTPVLLPKPTVKKERNSTFSKFQ